ncbi:1-acyl-sn-glycerol-3-phosphate acyltransferase [Tenacibaculum sp. MAR_2010_89]|uniref:lysophospholipid acyltransferase family protein n=1 Tax=Tenacibaculum sp. MAR_2010_89 TaxID=1250198 RepID=UPI0008973E2F|nr:lysophospholipid acyltransferase family protein [Tenacibaculum sp. MAR_2010_89]SED92171.1 1-acyl-sn-glycerol-3-phosphate acyltransferase [Tenacibaculum sp. MAR_2010_89]
MSKNKVKIYQTKEITTLATMKYFKLPFLLVWRIWFYILMFSTIIIMLPFLLVLTSDEKYYPTFWKMVRAWSFLLIYGMGFRLKIKKEQKIEKNKSYMFIANHASLLDPWVMIALSKNPIVFVGKKELVKIPVFGFFYRKVVIMVDRGSEKSRKRVYEMAKKRLKNGTSVGIFPEGLVPEEDIILAPFKNGAFSLAIEYQIPIVPQVYYDCKRFFSWNIFKGRPGTFRVKQCNFIETKGLKIEERKKLKQKVFTLTYNELKNDKLYMKDTNKLNNE